MEKKDAFPFYEWVDSDFELDHPITVKSFTFIEIYFLKNVVFLLYFTCLIFSSGISIHYLFLRKSNFHCYYTIRLRFTEKIRIYLTYM